ncbi:DNA protecting protein DprA [Aeromonas diversa CDC 2478-85]|uniref:DNA protecting protein DprA n=1 Tax=Aeromonas diversa CDC 2478-85 TaxID=1268237 RepID=N9U267_9GAMM|nr:DNA protecting protein DprA [Aeromonas diversa CDC 2478-85]
MPHDDRLTHWLTLWALPGIGPVTAWKLLEEVGGNVATLRASPAETLSRWGLTRTQIQALHHPSTDPSALLAWCEAPHHHLLTPDHPCYPLRLRAIPAAPLLLWCIGEPERLMQPQLAMVGSRHPTHVGLEMARRLSGELVAAGMTITSGLALGIDGASHQAALAAGGSTVAVLGSGLERVYPRRHQALFEQILAEGGALVSEFEPTQGPLAEHFPRRNRIISGLSLGTLVVEAAEQSGSLITARFALEQGREVFAVPGTPMNPQAAGCNRLIQQGAKLVTSAADIVEELGWMSEGTPLSTVLRVEPKSRLPEAGLLDNVDYEVTSVDVVAARARLPVEAVLGQLIELELEGKVMAVAGGYVRRGG